MGHTLSVTVLSAKDLQEDYQTSVELVVAVDIAGHTQRTSRAVSTGEGIRWGENGAGDKLKFILNDAASMRHFTSLRTSLSHDLVQDAESPRSPSRSNKSASARGVLKVELLCGADAVPIGVSSMALSRVLGSGGDFVRAEWLSITAQPSVDIAAMLQQHSDVRA